VEWGVWFFWSPHSTFDRWASPDLTAWKPALSNYLAKIFGLECYVSVGMGYNQWSPWIGHGCRYRRGPETFRYWQRGACESNMKIEENGDCQFAMYDCKVKQPIVVRIWSLPSCHC